MIGEGADVPPTISESETATIERLAAKIRADTPKFTRLSDYYEGLQKLEHLGLAIPPELRKFVVIVNWPRITADSLEERLDLEGFRLPGQTKRDAKLWRLWQFNNLDEESQLAHLDALIFGRSYVCIGSNEADESLPLITVESPLQMAADIDPRTRKVTAALRFWRDRDVNGYMIDRAVLYLPDSTVWAARLRSGGNRGWTVEARDDHELGVVPVVPIINRARVSDRDGVSELADVIDLTDSAARALTLAQLATETLSVPQKVLLGATESDFQDQDGNMTPKWEAYFGSVWSLENPDAKPFQFDSADLTNFKTIVDHYAAMVASVTGLPMRFFGQNTANPPSEGAIIADESRLIKKAERRHRAWGGAWEEVARIAKRITDGSVPDAWVELESIWRNPATPTRAQAADATVKLVQANILPVEAAWEEMGYSETRQGQLRAMRTRQLEETDVLARQMAVYRQGAPGAIETPTSTQSTPAASEAAGDF